MNPTAPSPYLTGKQTVTYFQLGSSSALYRLIREHGLPFCRVGSRYRFDRRELDAWAHGHPSALEWSRSSRKAG